MTTNLQQLQSGFVLAFDDGLVSGNGVTRQTSRKSRKRYAPVGPCFRWTLRSIAKSATVIAAWLPALFYLLGACGNSHAQALVPLTGIIQIAAGYTHNCALTGTGGVKCWGGNTRGGLGDNSTTTRLVPVDVLAGPGLPPLSGVSAIGAGADHTCALTSGGGVKCWGSNGLGQLGDDTIIESHTPVDVLEGPGLPPLSGAISISVGSYTNCAVVSGGGAKCWGYNLGGTVGDGSTTDRHTPVDVFGLTSGVSAIATSGNHTCALTSGGSVLCWGSNTYGEVGDAATVGFTRLTPFAIPSLTSGMSALEMGIQHSCALTTSGGALCWGNNFYSQLGGASGNNPVVPGDVLSAPSSPPLAGVSAISAGQDHSCAVASGGAKCWGYNFYGQVGDNTTMPFVRGTPVDVFGLTSGITVISAGQSHSCAITSGGGVKCWGRNNVGQLGNNSQTQSIKPVDVLVVPPVTLLAVQSRKTHGAAGPFNLPVDSTQPIAGPVTVEPRTIGAGHVIVFQFDGPITVPGSATTVDSNNSSIATTTAAGVAVNEVLVTLTGVADTSRAKVSLTGVNGAATVWPASIGFLVADVNNSRAVDSLDRLAVKARSGQTANGSNFQFDVNATGKITASDILAVKNRIGRVLAP